MRRLLCLVLLILVSGGCVYSGLDGRSSYGSSPASVMADTSFLEQYALTRRFSAGRPRSIKLVPDGTAVLFLRSEPRSFVHDLYQFDVQTGKERVLLTAEQILDGAAEHITAEESARRERMRLTARGIASYRMNEDGSRLLVPLSGRLFVVSRGDGDVTELHSDHGYPIDPRFSPDGSQVACVRGGEVFITDIKSGLERQLTDGAGGFVTNGLSEFVAQEEMGRFRGYWWSPDSKTIVYQQTSTDGVELMHIMDATHPEEEPRSWPYPRPGKKNAKVTLGLIAATGGETVWVNWDRERYPYLASVQWKDEAPLTLLVQNRRQTEEALLRVDRNTGYTEVLLIEKDDAWVNLDRSMPKWFPDGSGFLWTTERNGAWQLERRASDGQLVDTLTRLDFGYKGFSALDVEQRCVYVSGSDAPTQTHVHRISLDAPPARPQRLTTVPGQHSATFSKNCETWIHSASMADGSRQQTIRLADGTKVGSLKSNAETPPFVPKVELTTVGEGRKFHAALIRPRNFDPRRRYPVIVYVYAGPHGQMVSSSPTRYLLQQWMADHGFIVAVIDGRGTPSRGRAWERVIKGNLIEIALTDQVAGLQALGLRYPEMDMDNVGVYGWSFGGYFSAMAVMQRPDVYHAGIAGAPVCDWMDYDTHYTERYLDLPENNPDGYKASSVLTYVDKLERPLLIIHGTVDDNVYFTHSLKMSDALFRAGKPHEFLPLSGFTHMVPDPNVTIRENERLISFFKEHLIGG